MYISRENAAFDATTLDLNYFEDKHFQTCKEIQVEIECELGLLVTNMVTEEDQNGRKASLRNMTSYMFQHQNLMASKFALFYRFTDYYKRKDVIDQFPVFAGMISQEYYSTLIELNSLKAQLKRKEKQQKANVKSTTYIKKNLQPLLQVQTFLSENMNRLANTLDFEKEYRPINLNFGLVDQTFDLYHHQNGRDKIFLYEMGSGANWVSCHIALFLSFLRLFANNEKSPMPLFLFLDQPSQVYFPRGDEKTGELPHADIVAVSNMYKTIFDEVNGIAADTGVLPQVLIVDHVDGHALEIKEEFLGYTKCNWTDGAALI